jgi:peroxiredoxin
LVAVAVVARSAPPPKALELMTPTGTRVKVDETGREPTLCVTFSIHSCGSCMGESVEWAKLLANRETGLRIVGVLHSAATRDEVADYLEYMKFGFPVVLDPDDSVRQRYGLVGVPEPAKLLLVGPGHAVARFGPTMTPEERKALVLAIQEAVRKCTPNRSKSRSRGLAMPPARAPIANGHG